MNSFFAPGMFRNYFLTLTVFLALDMVWLVKRSANHETI